MAKITSWVKVQSDSHRKGESDRIAARSPAQIALRKHEGHCRKAVAFFTCLENRLFPAQTPLQPRNRFRLAQSWKNLFEF